jgi:hypothetical protein
MQALAAQIAIIRNPRSRRLPTNAVPRLACKVSDLTAGSEAKTTSTVADAVMDRSEDPGGNHSSLALIFFFTTLGATSPSKSFVMSSNSASLSST